MGPDGEPARDGEVGRPGPGDLVVLRTCGDNLEASVLRTLLVANGIPCVVQGEQHRSMLGMLGAYIEVRVLVPGPALKRALALMEDPQGMAVPGDDEDGELDGQPLGRVEPEARPPRGLEGREGGLRELPREERSARRRLFGWMAIAILIGPAAVGLLLSLLRGAGR